MVADGASPRVYLKSRGLGEPSLRVTPHLPPSPSLCAPARRDVHQRVQREPRNPPAQQVVDARLRHPAALRRFGLRPPALFQDRRNLAHQRRAQPQVLRLFRRVRQRIPNARECLRLCLLTSALPLIARDRHHSRPAVPLLQYLHSRRNPGVRHLGHPPGGIPPSPSAPNPVQSAQAIENTSVAQTGFTSDSYNKPYTAAHPAISRAQPSCVPAQRRASPDSSPPQADCVLQRRD